MDRAQRRFPPVAFPLAVMYKFWDDQGNNLAAIITYYAFVAVFPLLLLASSILGFVLEGNPSLQEAVLDTALAQHVAFMPGEPFFTDPDANPGYLRLNFSHIDPARLDEGLKRLAAVVRQAQLDKAA